MESNNPVGFGTIHRWRLSCELSGDSFCHDRFGFEPVVEPVVVFLSQFWPVGGTLGSFQRDHWLAKWKKNGADEPISPSFLSAWRWSPVLDDQLIGEIDQQMNPDLIFDLGPVGKPLKHLQTVYSPLMQKLWIMGCSEWMSGSRFFIWTYFHDRPVHFRTSRRTGRLLL